MTESLEREEAAVDVEAAAVQIRDFSKTFPGQKALSGLDLSLARGEVHALVGENGCGKSTFIKCLSGYQSPDDGAQLIVNGNELPIPFASGQAADHGLLFVHQDFGIIPNLTVMENIALGSRFETKHGRIRWRRQASRAVEALARLGREDISPYTNASTLSVSDHAIIAIARSLASATRGANLIVLDEPTAALPQAEVKVLFAVMRRLASQGVAVLFVSHRLQEVFDVADRVTVLRDSRKVGTYRIDELDERTLVHKIVGRELHALYPDVAVEARKDVVLEVEGLSGRRVENANFAAHEGEIIGIAGLQGSGRSEIIRLLFGVQQAAAGVIRVKGREVQLRSPIDAMHSGFAHVPEDRIRQGAFGRMTVGENLLLLTVHRYMRRGRIRRRPEKRRTRELVREFGVRPGDAEQLMGRLSGGNQQKGILAKWLEIDPLVLLLDEPAQGVDVGSKSEIYHLIERWVTDRGAAVIMVSSDFEDLQALCHRVLVLREGHIVAELSGETKTVNRMVELAYLKESA